MLAQASIHLPASTWSAVDAGLRQHDSERGKLAPTAGIR